jgi:hypothetical protein
MLGKESIRPAMMIQTTAATSPTTVVAQDAAQAHSNPAIQHDEGHAATVLKVLKPSFQRPIHVRDDDRQAIAVGPLRFLADRVSEFPKTLSTRPALASHAESCRSSFSDPHRRPSDIQLSTTKQRHCAVEVREEADNLVGKSAILFCKTDASC